jgi:hypothetical protein
MIDDNQFWADNGYNAVRLDVSQQLIPKIVLIRHHDRCPIERRLCVTLVFEYKSMVGTEEINSDSELRENPTSLFGADSGSHRGICLRALIGSGSERPAIFSLLTARLISRRTCGKPSVATARDRSVLLR